MTAPESKPQRLTYLDWLRGVSVLVMMQAHSFDAWTRPAEKARTEYADVMVLGGMASPLFLFLAGTAAALSASAHIERGLNRVVAARRVERRGLQILLLAFLFRLQSFFLGGFSYPQDLLRVDVLNVMGPAVMATAAFWRIPAGRFARGGMLAIAAAAVAAATPAIRQAGWLDALPEPVAAYFRPVAGSGAFTLFPWAAFVLAGAVVGLVLRGARGLPPWRLHLALTAVGAGLAVGAYWASWQPAFFEGARFWTTSPAFFCLRLGLLMLAVSSAWAWRRRWATAAPSPVEVMGLGSLFVYWVHVELVYGWVSRPLQGRLTLEQSAVAWVVLTLFMYLLLLGWNKYRAGRRRRASPVNLVSSTA